MGFHRCRRWRRVSHLVEVAMQYIRDLIHDLRAAWAEFRYIRRHLRRGGNPDEAF